MFDVITQVPLNVARGAYYWVLWRFHHRAPHHDLSDDLPAEDLETQTLRIVLREIREAEGCRISQLSDEATDRYARMLGDIIDARTPPLTPEQIRRADALLRELREKYGTPQAA